ncbi:MAG: SRPBCC family protein [Bacteroidota bacterium]
MKTLITFSSLFLGLMVAVAPLQAQKKKKAQTFTVSHVINAPAEKVWAVVGEDYGAIANSHPKIVSSNYINGTLKAGEGAERVCNFNEKGTQYLKEKQVNYDPDNYTFRNQVFQAGKFPVDPEYTYAIYKVEAIDDRSSRFTFDMNYRTKPAFMGGMMKGNFKKLIREYALAIEHHVNTGEPVNKDNFKSIKKSYATR